MFNNHCDQIEHILSVDPFLIMLPSFKWLEHVPNGDGGENTRLIVLLRRMKWKVVCMLLIMHVVDGGRVGGDWSHE